MMKKINLPELPNNPGCYIYKNSDDKVIYVGKAKNIRNRVNSYFNNKDLDPKTEVLVDNIRKIDFIVTNNEFESLVLENNLIKKFRPKYNIDLKDSKRYAYIQIVDEDFPRLMIAREKQGKGEYFGPFVSGANRDHVIYVLKRAFRLRTCKKFPKKPCLRHHIGLCDAPCVGLESKEEYDEKINNIRQILKGDTKRTISLLGMKMKAASQERRYEKAIEYREQISALEDLREKQRMERNKLFDEDIINYIERDGKVYLMLFNIHKGTLVNKQEFVFDSLSGFLEEFLIQYYSENPIPKEIVLAEEIDDSVKEFLEKKRKKRLVISIPKIGDKKNLLDLIVKNIEIVFFGDINKLEDLRDKLNLQDTPYVIECFDISHLSGTSTVASMVQFRTGKPDKTNYRRFKIRTVSGIDDTRSIAEVVRRRYYRIVMEKSSPPDLIVIDGGKAQLNFAMHELQKLGLKVPIISLAKKFEEVYMPDRSEPLRISMKSDAIKILQKIRDEAHRFAISYNRLLRAKEIREWI